MLISPLFSCYCNNLFYLVHILELSSKNICRIYVMKTVFFGVLCWAVLACHAHSDCDGIHDKGLYNALKIHDVASAITAGAHNTSQRFGMEKACWHVSKIPSLSQGSPSLHLCFAYKINTLHPSLLWQSTRRGVTDQKKPQNMPGGGYWSTITVWWWLLVHHNSLLLATGPP